MEAALKIWQPDELHLNRVQPRKPNAPLITPDTYDPYLELAEDWAWSLFDHALSAHMRGDTTVALSSALQLAKVQSAIEAEAARRGFPHPPFPDSMNHDKDKERPYLYFSRPIARNFSVTSSDAPGETQAHHHRAKRPHKHHHHPSRIAALINDLDMVQARQWGQPGTVMPEEDPIVQALIKEGDAAVEPLINCLENDKRLTRFRRFSPAISTAIASSFEFPAQPRAALQRILQVQFRNPSEFRTYWQQKPWARRSRSVGILHCRTIRPGLDNGCRPLITSCTGQHHRRCRQWFLHPPCLCHQERSPNCAVQSCALSKILQCPTSY